jgi:hypothetical protein
MVFTMIGEQHARVHAIHEHCLVDVKNHITPRSAMLENLGDGGEVVVIVLVVRLRRLKEG